MLSECDACDNSDDICVVTVAVKTAVCRYQSSLNSVGSVCTTPVSHTIRHVTTVIMLSDRNNACPPALLTAQQLRLIPSLSVCYLML